MRHEMIKQSLPMMILLFSLTIDAAIVLKGNKEAAANETFSFQIQKYLASDSPDLVGTTLFVGANPTEGGTNKVNEFSVSQVTRDTTQFIGLTPKEALFNDINKTQQKSANPLYDVGISFMALFNGAHAESILNGAPERPMVVASNDLKTIYLINNRFSNGTVEIISVQANGLAIQNIPDATSAVTAGIVGIEAAAPYFFAAVRPTAGIFGATGSGVALGMIGQVNAITKDGKESPIVLPFILDGETGSIARVGGNRAVPFDVSSTFLKIGNDLVSISSIVDMFWDPYVARLYIALEINGGAAGTDGGRAIAVGRVTDKNMLEFSAIAPTTAFDVSLNKIVGAVGSNVSVSIHKVRGMFTTTALPYLVVQGNVGTSTATRRDVFAMPLVSGSGDITLNGTIADKNAEPENIYSPEGIPSLAHRIIREPATTPSQMPLSSDVATQVGGGILPDGDITDLFVYGDTVFATVQTSDINDQAGVFYSQAIFEANGKIKSWTLWRRATGTPVKVQSVVLDPMTGQFSSLVANSANQVKIVQRTEWKEGNATGLKPVTDAMKNFFLPQEGGIQGLFDFVVTATTSGTATPGLLDISALVATGLGKVMLVQTSSVIAGGVIPVGGSSFGAVSTFINGEITQTFPVIDSKIITIEGGVLADIGPINAAEIARDGTGPNGNLFVGGANGVAVLSRTNGAGWSTATGLSNGFLGLTNDMSFKKVGTYKEVYKLINDGPYLYVLTLTQLDRIDLTQGNVGLGIISPMTIATRKTIPGIGITGSFLDAIISGPLAVLATSKGLFRLAEGLDIRTVRDTTAWEHLPAPETIGPMEQLLAITPTDRAQDITSRGGNILALSAYRGKNQAQIARYSVDASTVTRIDDLFVKDIPSYFANFGLFYNGIATDGSLYYGTHNQQLGDENAFVSVLFSTKGVYTGSRFLSNKIIPVDVKNTSLIASLIQNSATGSWLIGTDRGLRVNE